MRRFLVLIAALAALAPWPAVALGERPARSPVIRVEGLDEGSGLRLRPARPAGPVGVSDSPETVSVGYAPWSADPNKVGAGGVWDFDTGVAGTDSMQFWTSVTVPVIGDQSNLPTPGSRSMWYFDYGNNINLGDHGLWKARLADGRAFRRTGLAGVWHVDDMSNVSAPIAGSRSAWCGLRVVGDCTVRDELTGNCFEGGIELTDFRGGGYVRSGYPGFAGWWDQLLYRDFIYQAADVPLSFRFRASLSSSVPTLDPGGSAWYTPDPTDTLNLVLHPADSLEVWVGAPREAGVYDPNRRWLSDVLDFGLPGPGQPLLLMAVSTNGADGRIPLAAPDTAVSYTIPGARDWGPGVRVVFRVKTNRGGQDHATTSAGFNSVDGAALVDNVSVGGVLSDFEDPLAVRPRVLLGPAGEETWIDPTTTWITTGRPAPAYGHVHDRTTLPFDHPAIGPGDTQWNCNMTGNVLVQSNHDDPQHRFAPQVWNWTVSPTICLSGPRAAEQGIPATLRDELEGLNLRFDWYSGFDDLSYSSVLMFYALRTMGPGPVHLQPVAPAVPGWTPFVAPGIDIVYGNPACLVMDSGSNLSYSFWPQVDSLQVAFQDQTRCARFAASACGDARGHYFDNLRVQFVRAAPFTGIDLEPQLDFVSGPYPNPSPDGTATVRFRLRRAAQVRIAFYDARGALVHEAQVEAAAGPNEYRWEGITRAGRAADGVYFYRLYADGVEFRNNAQRLVVLGAGER